MCPLTRMAKITRQQPVGSGRYMLEQWDKGQQVILAANPDYYGETPRMKRVIVVFMEEDAALAAANSAKPTSHSLRPLTTITRLQATSCLPAKRLTAANLAAYGARGDEE